MNSFLQSVPGYFIAVFLGTDAMVSKSKQKEIMKKSQEESKHRSSKKQTYVRCTVTNRAPTSDKECPVKFRVYLSASNH